MQLGIEQFVNDFCPAISLAWGGNIDIQYICGNLFDIVAYVCGYVAKSEVNKENHELRDALREAMTSKEGFKALSDLLRQRQTGTFEISDQLMGHSMAMFDTAHMFVNTNAPQNRHRRLKPREVIESLQDEQEVYRANTLDHYYPQRHFRLETVTLYQIMCQFTVEKRSNKTSRTSRGTADEMEGFHKYANPFKWDYHTTCPYSPFFDFAQFPPSEEFDIFNTGKAHRRLNKPIALRLYFPNLEPGNEEAREDYFRRLILMFIPWR